MLHTPHLVDSIHKEKGRCGSATVVLGCLA